MTKPLNITIAGAGLAGSLLGVLLARRGHVITLLEQRPDPRAAGFKGGRSINLALSTRGIVGLERAGLSKRVLEDGVPMPGRMLHEPDGRTLFQPYSKDATDHLNSVSRGGLNIALIEAAEALDNVTVRCEHRAIDADVESATLTTQTPDGATHTHEADLLIGADGAYSGVREALRRSDRFDYQQSYLEHGYKELRIPPREDRSGVVDFAMAPNALHIWPRRRNMMIALPNADRSFTCTIFWPYLGTDSFETINTPERALEYFKRAYPDAVALMPTLAADFAANPVSSLVTIRCGPWARGRTLLIGDAAHAIVPFYGQGMNAAFEDCVLLDDALAGPADGVAPSSHDDIERAIARFAEERKPHADAIADLALDNFVEMRDHTASGAFLLKKKAEQRLHKWFPDRFTPLYNMISFTTIPYADAVASARRQSRAITGVGVAAVVVLLIVVLVVALLISL